MKKIIFLLLAFTLFVGNSIARDVGSLQPTVQTEFVTPMQTVLFTDYTFVQSPAPAVINVSIVIIKPQSSLLTPLLCYEAALWIDPGRDAYLTFINSTQISRLEVSILSLNNLNRMSLSRICGNEFNTTQKKDYSKIITLTRHVTFS